MSVPKTINSIIQKLHEKKQSPRDILLQWLGGVCPLWYHTFREGGEVGMTLLRGNISVQGTV